MIQKFEDLEVWKESFQLSVDIYKMLKEDFGLRDQLQRASVSIPSNIAEGFERNTNKDFIKFLYILSLPVESCVPSFIFIKQLVYLTSEQLKCLLNVQEESRPCSTSLFKPEKINFNPVSGLRFPIHYNFQQNLNSKKHDSYQ